MTSFGKIDYLRALTEIHFLSVRKSYTHALPKNTKYLTPGGQVCTHGQLFANAVEPRGYISRPCMTSTAWGTKLFFMTVLAQPVYFISSHLLNGCFNPPSAPHPPHLLLPPTHPLWTQSMILQELKNYLKTSKIQLASRNSYKMIAILTTLFIQ